jgi:actin-related protein
MISSPSSNFEFISPVVNGRLTDIDSLVAIWEEASLHHEVINPAAFNLLHSTRSSVSSLKEGALAAIEAAFERFGTSAYYDASSVVLALYAAGRTTGIVVELGAGSTCISAVYEGYLLPDTTSTFTDYSGDTLTGQTQSVLRETHPQLDALFSWNVAEYIKTKMISIPLTPEDLETANILISFGSLDPATSWCS